VSHTFLSEEKSVTSQKAKEIVTEKRHGHLLSACMNYIRHFVLSLKWFGVSIRPDKTRHFACNMYTQPHSKKHYIERKISLQGLETDRNVPRRRV
jgi:hypothetical protein